MQELISQIADRAGISEDSATTAVNEVIEYVKQHAPAPIATQLENYLTGDPAGAAVGAGKAALGEMLGKRDTE